MPANPKPKRIKPESTKRKYVCEVVMVFEFPVSKKQIRAITQDVLLDTFYAGKTDNDLPFSVRVQNIDERQL